MLVIFILSFVVQIDLRYVEDHEKLELKWPSVYYTRGRLMIPEINGEETFAVWIDANENRGRYDYNEESSHNVFFEGMHFSIFYVTTDIVTNEKVCVQEDDFNLHHILPEPDSFEFEENLTDQGINATRWVSTTAFAQHIFKETVIAIPENDYYIPVSIEISKNSNKNKEQWKSQYFIIFEEFKVHACLPRSVFLEKFEDINCNFLDSVISNKEFISAKFKSLKRNIYGDFMALKTPLNIFAEMGDEPDDEIFHISDKSRLLPNVVNIRQLLVDFHNRKNERYFMRLNKDLNLLDINSKASLKDLRGNEFLKYRRYNIDGTFPIVVNWDQNGTSIPLTYVRKYISASEKRLNLPLSMDWRKLVNAPPLVKYQRSCGSCWAFTTTNAFEWAGQIYMQKSVNLSERYLIDCSYSVNLGCYGGHFVSTYYWIAKNGDIPTVETYGYNSINNRKCRNSYKGLERPFKSILASIGFVYSSIDELKLFIFLFGPTPVTINSKVATFHYYGGGIYTDSNCSNSLEDADHTITIIGYDKDNSGHEYWIGQNSWSDQWGEEGYIRISMNDNLCGIRNLGAVPVLDL